MPIERLRATQSFLREFMEAVPGAVYAKDREGRILLGNEAFAEAVGWQAGGFIGKTDLDLLADKDLARTIVENDRRIMAGAAKCQVEEKLRAEDGTVSYWLSTKAPFTDDQGDCVGLVGVSLDITERKQQERRERLLAREVEHRNKNLLGVIQSIVRLTSTATIEEYREAVLGRLEALSRVQGVLTHEQRQKPALKDILLNELAAYGLSTGGRVRWAGPEIQIGTNAAQPLAMIFHELATNAAKYGAFADASGSLDLVWELSGCGTELHIEWCERASRLVEPPNRKGFGTRLISTIVEKQFRGNLLVEWEKSGIRCSISLPTQSVSG